jgi:hypothetical protein
LGHFSQNESGHPGRNFEEEEKKRKREKAAKLGFLLTYLVLQMSRVTRLVEF